MPTAHPPGPGDEVVAVFRQVYGEAVATLVRLFGDITVAEDSVQDAFTVATQRWRTDGIPPNPAGWIVTTAKNRAIDTIRRATRGRELQGQIENDEVALEHRGGGEEVAELMGDDRLRLIFTCCHPALRPEHRIALTLRLLGGLSIEEIARSFLVSESAMAKRLVRAKYKIKAANIPYRIPSDADLPERLASVLTVLYLIYNTGADDQSRAPLRGEAIRLARSLAQLMPDEPEAAGLVALMLLNEARMRVRFDGLRVVLLSRQDRSRWDGDLIDEGTTIVRRCIRSNRPGPFQLQAAIQAVHCSAESFESTDWDQIISLYEHLLALQPTSIVAMNRAIAIGERDGPRLALAELDRLTTQLDDYHLLHAARATMLQRLGDLRAAGAEFTRASELTSNPAERQSLTEQIDLLGLDGARRLD